MRSFALTATLAAASMLTTASMLTLGGCASMESASELGRFERASDLATFHIARVGVLPFQGANMSRDEASELASMFASAFAREAHVEARPLGEHDLEEVPQGETFRRGWTPPAVSIALARRFELDAIVVGAVRRAQWFPPLRVDLDVDLIAVETGLPVWTGSIELDAGDGRVRNAMKRWIERERKGRDGSGQRGESFELYLISRRLFVEFAVTQLARGW